MFVFFALTVFPYMIYLNWIVSSASAADLDMALAGMASMLIQFNLAVALLLAGIRSGMPRWAAVVAVVLMPLYWVGTVTVPEVLKDGEPVRWMVAILVLDPLLVLGYIAWISIPALRDLVSPSLVAGVVWGSVFVLSTIPLFKNVGEAERAQKREAARARPAKEHIAKLKRLPVEAPVGDVIEFVTFEETHDEAMRRIRAAQNKESQLEELVNDGDETAFAWLSAFDVTPTPGLCQCVRKFLRDHTAEAKRTNGRSMAGTQRYLPTLEWAAKHKCAMLDEFGEFIDIVHSYYPEAKTYMSPSTKYSAR